MVKCPSDELLECKDFFSAKYQFATMVGFMSEHRSPQNFYPNFTSSVSEVNEWLLIFPYLGVEQTDICLYLVSLEACQLPNRSRRQASSSSPATQHSVGYDLSCRDARGG